MAKLTIYFLVIVILCQSIAVFSKQVDFDNFNLQGGNSLSRQQRQADATTTTVAPASLTRCLGACNTRVTPQYNPVCGTNGQSYNNPQRLQCAQQCGLQITVSHGGTCGPSPGGK